MLIKLWRVKSLAKPEDLKVRIGTNAEIFWSDFKKKCQEDIMNAERAIEINNHLIKLASEKVEFHRIK